MDQQTDGQKDRQTDIEGHSRVHATKKLLSNSGHGLTKKNRVPSRFVVANHYVIRSRKLLRVDVHCASKESILAQNVSRYPLHPIGQLQ